jgi:RNA polymerase sigma-70 factor (sigma-E family)
MAFEEFMAERAGALLRLAGVLSGDSYLAEDIVQEVLVKVGRHWEKVQRSNSPAAYVRRRVVNEYLSWQRKWGRITSRQDIMEGGDIHAVVPDLAQTVADRDAMLEALRRLPRRHRSVLVLRYYEDLSDSDIAQALGCSQATVRTHAARALRALRRRGQGSASRPRAAKPWQRGTSSLAPSDHRRRRDNYRRSVRSSSLRRWVDIFVTAGKLEHA